MNRLRQIVSRGVASVLVLLLSTAMPATVLADTAPSGDSSTGQSSSDANTSQSAPAAASSNGPTGSASGTYHYNSSTGLWENDYYTYDPATHLTTPKTPLEYTYNQSTGQWDTQVWQYNAAKGAYEQDTVSVASPPSGAIVHGGPVDAPNSNSTTSNDTSAAPANSQSQTTTTSNNPDGSSTSSTSMPTSSTSTTVSPNGAADTLDKSRGSTTNLTFNNAGTITNIGTSNATTGNIQLQSNTTAGNAGSGNATDVANYLNLLQSQASLAGGNVAAFTKTIQGDVTGDLVIDPTSFMQPASIPDSNLTNLKVNTANDNSIVNNVNLNANSGNVDATKNTTTQNVSSGSANAIADVVNMINSVVAANQSFMGVINIEGNYTGDILVPTDSLNALLGSSASDPGPNNGQPAVTDIRSTSDQNINNNVNLAAASGNAAASSNTTTGTVASGNGMTNLTILNLTGRNVVAANSLLVFVNVLGSWVGLIMDAPAGTTAAALGGGVTSNTTAPSLTENLNNSDKSSITNNITASANSGNVDAAKNTTIGNVTSGNATASANVANLIGSNFSLSNWFGVLFINVLGTWHGNFGTVKPSVVPAITSGASGPASGAVSQPKVFQFVSRGGSGSGGNGASGGLTTHGHYRTNGTGTSNAELTLSPLSQANQQTTTSADMVAAVSKVLGASTDKAATSNTPQLASQSTSNKVWSIVAVAIGTLGLAYVGTDRVRTNLRNRRMAQK